MNKLEKFLREIEAADKARTQGELVKKAIAEAEYQTMAKNRISTLTAMVRVATEALQKLDQELRSIHPADQIVLGTLARLEKMAKNTEK